MIITSNNRALAEWVAAKALAVTVAADSVVPQDPQGLTLHLKNLLV